jgi:hypothetical protein
VINDLKPFANGDPVGILGPYGNRNVARKIIFRVGFDDIIENVVIKIINVHQKNPYRNSTRYSWAARIYSDVQLKSIKYGSVTALKQ